MCRLPKVIVVGPKERHTDLRRALSSLEYDIVAAVTSADEAAGIVADAAVAWEPDEKSVSTLRTLGLKTVSIGPNAAGADLHLVPEDISQFKKRVWELFAPP